MAAPSEVDLLQYQAVAARRLQWDNLLWQVPVLSLTAQAFLMTISLGSDTTDPARLISSGLSIVTTFLCIQLMHRHRAGELADAKWLAEWESRFNAPQLVHGPEFAAYRKQRIEEGIHAGMPFEAARQRLTNWRSFTIWVAGLTLFGVASTGVLLVTAVHLLLG